MINNFFKKLFCSERATTKIITLIELNKLNTDSIDVYFIFKNLQKRTFKIIAYGYCNQIQFFTSGYDKFPRLHKWTKNK